MARVDARADPAVDDARLAIDTLARRASGIMHFVEAYRDFSRAPVVERRPFAAATWAVELKRLFEASAQGAGVAFALAVEPADLVIDGDPDLLAQVMINLLKNGAQAARSHGPEPRVALEIRRVAGGRCRLSVADNGPGIPSALADEIFLPFFTTKAGGTGVGLSLARRIVTAHGGTIALGDGAGEGARFDVTL